VGRQWLLPCLLIQIACSDGAADSGSRDAPTLVLRCNDGHLSGYMVTGTPEEIAAGDLESEAVEVRFDSAPQCAESAP
jgi:hypothetical protein